MLAAAEGLRPARSSLIARRPWLVAFGFGLLHGFGFAGALTEVGLPEDAVPLALLFFNLGIEAGQILFVTLLIAALWGLRALWGKGSDVLLRRTLSYGAGSLGAFWFIGRTISIVV